MDPHYLFFEGSEIEHIALASPDRSYSSGPTGDRRSTDAASDPKQVKPADCDPMLVDGLSSVRRSLHVQ